MKAREIKKELVERRNITLNEKNYIIRQNELRIAIIDAKILQLTLILRELFNMEV